MLAMLLNAADLRAGVRRAARSRSPATATGPSSTSAVLAVAPARSSTLELIITKWVQHWPAARAASLGLLLLGAGLTGWGIGIEVGLAVLFLATIVGVFGQIIGGPTLFAWPVKVAPPAAQGRYVGLGNGVFWVGQVPRPGPRPAALPADRRLVLVRLRRGRPALRGRRLGRACRSGPSAIEDLPIAAEVEPAAGPAVPSFGPEIEEVEQSGGGRHRG